MPIGSELKALDSKNEMHFKEFYEAHWNIICACFNVPPEVAMSKYDSNFSASRAALKDWEHTLNVERYEFSHQFYKPLYKYVLETEILKNKIHAPGYLMARIKGDDILVEAYSSARFIGTPVPHIDPVKEVQAERLKLGGLGANLPMTTLEKATEVLNGGESLGNMQQYAQELEEAEQLNITMPAPPTALPAKGD